MESRGPAARQTAVGGPGQWPGVVAPACIPSDGNRDKRTDPQPLRPAHSSGVIPISSSFPAVLPKAGFQHPRNAGLHRSPAPGDAVSPFGGCAVLTDICFSPKSKTPFPPVSPTNPYPTAPYQHPVILPGKNDFHSALTFTTTLVLLPLLLAMETIHMEINLGGGKQDDKHDSLGNDHSLISIL